MVSLLLSFIPSILTWQVLAQDLLNPLPATESKKHKLKKLVQAPNSYFMVHTPTFLPLSSSFANGVNVIQDVKCPGCFNITTVFSHAQTVVLCGSCSTVLCQPSGGKARLTEGSSFRYIPCSRSLCRYWANRFRRKN